MKKIVSLLFLLLSMGLYSQNNGSIKGKVIDLEVNNEPLLLADIHLKNTEWSTQTNLNGNYEIANVEPGLYTLVISFLGYETVEMPVEITKNAITEVHSGLAAKSLDLSALTGLISQSNSDTNTTSSSLEDK